MRFKGGDLWQHGRRGGAAMAGIEHLTTWIGRRQACRDRIEAHRVRQLAATLDLPEAPGGEETPLPACWHWAFFQEIEPMSELGRDGHAALGGFLPPVELPRRMWAGGELVIERPLRVGETVERVSTVRDVTEKRGQGGALVFVTVEHVFAGEAGGAMTERHDIVYRDRPRPDDAPPRPRLPEREATSRRAVAPDPVLLFRYSAATFNGHRIHYDADFCRNEEGYPGLVVHGPLTVTLLAGLATRVRPGTRVARLAFRAMSPLFHPHPIALNAAADGDGLALWAESQEGALAMSAQAELVPA
jgi:3-methylfumaryl-CoA hydratase